MPAPKISVITICFNNLDDLVTTCKRVDSQSLEPFEHLIIDGSTKPDIKNWLENTPQPSYRRWICERDKGISDAFNKGIMNAKGDVLHLHNSGDYYYDDSVLETVSKHFSGDTYIGWLHGKYAQYRAGMWVISGKPYERSKLYRGMRTLGHPTFFVRKEMYDKHGLFSLDKKIAMDFDFLVRMADEPFAFIDKPLVYFTPGGVSDTKVQASLDEMLASYYQYKGFSIKALTWSWRTRLISELITTKVGQWLFQLRNKHKKTVV
ncbi:MAG: glycosyltransferase [Bacteroidia bacterium]